MTPRDHFAALAPTEIPRWFTYGDDLPPIPSILPIHLALEAQADYAALSADDKDHANAWLRDGTWDIEEEPLRRIVHAAADAIQRSRDDRREAEEQREAERYFAWRWHYADAMLNTRCKATGSAP